MGGAGSTSVLSGMRPYERFAAWQHCHALALAIYQASAGWPASERYGLVAQVRRAAFSAAANIVEGSAKRGTREFRRFLDISLGSLAEVTYALRLARDLNYLTPATWTVLDDLATTASKTTWGLYRRVSRFDRLTA